MILIIDTSSQERFTIALAGNDGVLVNSETQASHFTQAEKLLPTISSFLQSNKVRLPKLSGLAVVRGPGGFTSLRIGTITANTLAYALSVPVVGFKLNEFRDIKDIAKKASAKIKKAKLGTMVVPHYGQEPNITKPKNKMWRLG